MCMRSCVDHINGVVDDAATPKKSLGVSTDHRDERPKFLQLGTVSRMA